MARVFTVAGTNWIDFGDLAGMDGATTMTWSFWAKKDNIGDGVRIGKIAAGNTVGSFFNANVDGIVYFGIRDGSTSVASLTYENTNWNHYVCVYDGGGATDADKQQLYINGVNQSLSWNSSPPTTTASTSDSFDVGQFTGNYSDGHIAEVKWWTSALTAEEALQDYYGYIPSWGTTLSLYAPLGYGSPEIDYSGNGNDGTVTNSPALSDHPPVSMPFNGDFPFTL